jgi:hypothetical protein
VNATIASVSSSGVVTGVSVGSTSVSAVIDGTIESITVTVDPARVASVEVRPLVGQVLVGATIQMTATPRSASGLPLAGRVVSWSSSDNALATVSSSGLVTGVAGGDVTITATVELQAGTGDLFVLDPTAPRIQALTPFPMVEGQAATVTGLNFGAAVVDNTVTVDGVAATVTAASATSVTFAVPSTGCRPLRSVTVRVTAGGKSGAFAHPLRPAAFTQVGVGEQVVVSGISLPCLQFDATNSFESYLVGIQSVSEDPASITQVQLVARIGLAATGAGPVGPAPASGAALTALGTSATRMELDPVVASHARRHLEARAAESTLLASGLDFGAAASGALQNPVPPGSTVGQRFSVRVPPHYPGSCTQSSTIQAELRLITTRGHWLVDVADLATSYSSAELQTLASTVEQEVLAALEPMFGSVPDTDSNPRLTFVITRKVNEEGWLSYASLFDYLPVGTCAASNEGDLVYIATPQAGTTLSASFLMSVMGFSLAHDFTHVIQNRAVIGGGARAPAWIEEGQAAIGEETYAHRVLGRMTRQNYGSSVMFSQLGQIQPYGMVGSLAFYFGFQASDQPKVTGAPEQCTWLDPRDDGTTNTGPCLAPGPSSGAWAFLRWLTDHYGEGLGGDGVLHQGLIDTSGAGFARVETVVGVPVETLLARFAATLYADDRIVPVEATLDFPSWNLLEFDSAVFPAARLTPRSRSFVSLTESSGVRGASTLYYLFSASGRPATALEFAGLAGTPLSSSAQVWIVRLQ